MSGQDSLFMTPLFEAVEIDTDSKENKAMMTFNQKLDPDKAKYKDMSICSLEEVFQISGSFESQITNFQDNLIILIGDPGVGKTTVAHRLALRWAKGKGCLPEKYKLIFIIPVRHVGGGSLLNILSALKLLPVQITGVFQCLSTHAKDILFILDGADENDITDELHQLITGKLFSGSTVLLTARPEAKCLNSLTELPRVRIQLLGTDEKSAEMYIKKALAVSSEAEWKSIQKSYQDKIPNQSFLHVPLFVALLCTLFNENISKGHNLQMPKSTTELFNAFLYVIIKRCLSNDNLDISFEKSPLDRDSKVPAHMKRWLDAVGKLCYMDLTSTQSKYQFTETQVVDSHLDMHEIKSSGLFTVGKSGNEEVFSLIHKQFQEYLAALYLSCEGSREPLFHELLHSEDRKGQCLAHVIRSFKLVKTVEFTCGLSDKFLKSLLDRAVNQFCIIRSEDEGLIDIYYEAALFITHNSGDLSDVDVESLNGFSELRNYLLNSGIRDVKKSELFALYHGRNAESVKHITFYQKCQTTLNGLLDKDLAIQLLARFYNMSQSLVTNVGSTEYTLQRRDVSCTVAEVRQSPVTSKQSMKRKLDQPLVSSVTESSNPIAPLTSVTTLLLDQLQSGLLGVVSIPGVQTVKVGQKWLTSAYVDVSGLLQTFPHLRELDIVTNYYWPVSSNQESNRELNTSLILVRLSQPAQPFPISLPCLHVQALLQQSNLTYLKLVYVNPFPALVTCLETNQSLWSHLEHFTLWDDVYLLSRVEVRTICCVLQANKSTLKEYGLGMITTEDDTTHLIEEGLKMLTQVKSLWLLVKKSDTNITNDVLQSVRPFLSHLENVEISRPQDERLVQFYDKKDKMPLTYEQDLSQRFNNKP